MLVWSLFSLAENVQHAVRHFRILRMYRRTACQKLQTVLSWWIYQIYILFQCVAFSLKRLFVCSFEARKQKHFLEISGFFFSWYTWDGFFYCFRQNILHTKHICFSYANYKTKWFWNSRSFTSVLILASLMTNIFRVSFTARFFCIIRKKQ